MGAGGPDVTHYVDITDAVDRKIEALLCHKSQLPDPEATGHDGAELDERDRASVGLPEGRFAEAVRVVNTG